MAAPTLETNAGADTLRILDGTSGDPVTWNDVWDWDDGGGSSGGDGDVPKDGGGTAKVNTFMTETVADAVYLILKDVDFGDGSTPSYFASEREMVYMVGFTPVVRTNATLRIGVASNEFSIDGSYWRFSAAFTARRITHGGTMLILGSIIKYEDSFLYFFSGNLTIKNSNIFGFAAAETSRFVIANAMTSVILSDLYITSPKYGLEYEFNGGTLEDVQIENSQYGFFLSNNDITVENFNFTNSRIADVRVGTANTATVKNSVNNLSTPFITSSSGIVIEQYTVNIHVRDKDGVNLEDVTVICEDQFDSEVFNVQTGADGKIAEQTVNYKQWVGTDETLTTFSPHKFTFIKATHLTIVMENITIDEKKDWELELLPGETINISDSISVSESVTAQVVGLDTTIRFDTESRVTRYDTVPV